MAAHSPFNFPFLPNPVHRYFHLAHPTGCFGVFGILDLLHSTDTAFLAAVSSKANIQTSHDPQPAKDRKVARLDGKKIVPGDSRGGTASGKGLAAAGSKLRGETQTLQMERGDMAGSKLEILSYSVVHQAALFLSGLGAHWLVGTRVWVPLTTCEL